VAGEVNPVNAGESVQGFDLPIGRYRIRFEVTEPARISSYTGPAWRGAFGRALRSDACIAGLCDCKGCPLRGNCVYTFLFETSPPPDAKEMGKYKDLPRPYVLDPSETFQSRSSSAAIILDEGSRYELAVTLIGSANRFLQPVVQALDTAASEGIRYGKCQRRHNTKQTFQFSDRLKLRRTEIWQEVRPGGGEWRNIGSPALRVGGVTPQFSFSGREGVSGFTPSSSVGRGTLH
jgi:hypothetical protein